MCAYYFEIFGTIWRPVPVLRGKQSNRTDYEKTMIIHETFCFWTTISSRFVKRLSYGKTAPVQSSYIYSKPFRAFKDGLIPNYSFKVT